MSTFVCKLVDTRPSQLVDCHEQPKVRSRWRQGRQLLGRDSARRLPGSALSLTVAWTLAVAVGLGCGRKAAPKPPEFVAPSPITDLRAANDGEGILLLWSRPSEHADGTPLTSLGSFVVERAPAAGNAGFQVLETLEVADRDRFRKKRRFKYVDSSTEVGAGYMYRVITVTDDGYVSQPSNTASLERQRPLPQGPDS